MSGVTAEGVVLGNRRARLVVTVPELSLGTAVVTVGRAGGLVRVTRALVEGVGADETTVDLPGRVEEVESGTGGLDIWVEGSEPVIIRPFDRVRVRVRALQSRAHGPSLTLELVSILERASERGGSNRSVGGVRVVVDTGAQQPTSTEASLSRNETVLASPFCQTSEKDSLYSLIEQMHEMALEL